MVVLFSILSCFISCSKKECEIKNPICNEIVPTNELCAAVFKRWFYDAGLNSCKEISYSGCSKKGFATKQECEQCKCK
jgi:hypothetical protein